MGAPYVRSSAPHASAGGAPDTDTTVPLADDPLVWGGPNVELIVPCWEDSSPLAVLMAAPVPSHSCGGCRSKGAVSRGTVQ